MINMLTVKQIEAIQPLANKAVKNFDSELLYLFTATTGRKVWKVIYTFNGKKNTTTLGEYPIFSAKEARLKRDEIKKQIAEGIDPNQKKKDDRVQKLSTISLSELINKYIHDIAPKMKGGTKTASRLKKLVNDYPKLMKKSINDINQLDMIEIRNDRLSKVSTSTVKCDLGALGSVFKFARQELRILSTSPLIDVAKPTQAPHRERRITQDEIKTILNGFNYDATYQPLTKRQQVAWAFLFALETAMRASEITNMQWCNVYEDHVLLPDTKNGTARKVPLSRRAIQLLELMKGLDNDKVLTISDRSNALSHDFWLVVSNKLGITDLNFHDTRHEATTRLAKKLPIQDLAKVTGHKDLKMLMRYYNPTVQELALRLNEDDSNVIQFKKAVVNE